MNASIINTTVKIYSATPRQSHKTIIASRKHTCNLQYECHRGWLIVVHHRKAYCVQTNEPKDHLVEWPTGYNIPEPLLHSTTEQSTRGWWLLVLFFLTLNLHNCDCLNLGLSNRCVGCCELPAQSKHTE